MNKEEFKAKLPAIFEAGKLSLVKAEYNTRQTGGKRHYVVELLKKVVLEYKDVFEELGYSINVERLPTDHYFCLITEGVNNFGRGQIFYPFTSQSVGEMIVFESSATGEFTPLKREELILNLQTFIEEQVIVQYLQRFITNLIYADPSEPKQAESSIPSIQ